MKLEQYLKQTEHFIKDYLENNHMDNYVLGLSGGVDSSLVAALTRNAVGKDHLIAVAIPIDSIPEDLKDAKRVAKILDVNLIIFDGSEMFHEAVKEFKKLSLEPDRSTLANVKARIRMSILYAIAQANRGLVIGTDNACERYTGYYTKYGDGGVDVLPISKLLKREVCEGCKLYGLPLDLAERTPSAGLFEGQTDEKEMGIKYQTLDDYLLGKEIDDKSKERIEYLHKISKHKRDNIPEMDDFIRD